MIRDIVIRKIFDSRAEETLEVNLIDANGNSFWAQIPAGKSTGSNEAVVLSFEEAQKVLKNVLGKELHNKFFNSVRELDDFLVVLDNTKNKSRLGGNLMLGISIAFARALAFEKRKELSQLLNEEFFGGEIFFKKPMIFSNLINGGAHAGNNLNIQEYMTVVKISKSIEESVQKLIAFYKEIGELLKKKNKVSKLIIGDEGGYAIDFKNNLEPLEVMEKLIHKLKLEKDFFLGLDVAASNFWKNGKYIFESKGISAEKLNAIYINYFKKIKLLYSIEDPFDEKDLEGFRVLSERLGNERVVIGDDLTTTDPKMIERAGSEQLINGVIIKPNQIGTVTETCDAIRMAHSKGMKTVISHRSGETDDNFIIHLAKASGADGVKIGAPIRERIYKFNELIRIFGE